VFTFHTIYRILYAFILFTRVKFEQLNTVVVILKEILCNKFFMAQHLPFADTGMPSLCSDILFLPVFPNFLV
jgi:hypothetical protein